MGDPSRYSDAKSEGRRRWVRVLLIVALVVALLVIIMVLAGGHGPRLH